MVSSITKNKKNEKGLHYSKISGIINILYINNLFCKEKGHMNNKRIRIKLKSFDNRLLDKSVEEIVELAKRSGVKIVGPVPLPTKREIYTVLRSPHVNKKSREQFEIRVHKRLIDIMDSTARTVDSLSKLNLPSGVEVEMKLG